MPETLLHYQVLELLGEGARSKIYSVLDPQSRKTFALKHVVRKEPKDIRFIEQMETEFELSRKFSNVNLRRSYELKVIKSMLLKVTEAYLVMEYVDGKPLEERPPSNMMAVIDVFIQAAAGLKAMHQLGFVHCDIKPNNILCNDAGEVKVIDYGQSCPIGTVKERIQGTPDFIAPEQVGRKPVSIQTDVYNLGATLYWACTGKHIPTLYTVNKKGENSFLVDDRIDTPQELNPKVPTAVSNLIVEMISTRQQKRPADMDEVANRLELGKFIMEKANGSIPETPASTIIMDDSIDGASASNLHGDAAAPG